MLKRKDGIRGCFVPIKLSSKEKLKAILESKTLFAKYAKTYFKLHNLPQAQVSAVMSWYQALQLS